MHYLGKYFSAYGKSKLKNQLLKVLLLKYSQNKQQNNAHTSHPAITHSKSIIDKLEQDKKSDQSYHLNLAKRPPNVGE